MKQNLIKMMRVNILIISAVILTVTACKKDDEKPAYTFSVDGDVKVITKALLIYDPTVNSTARKAGLTSYYRNDLVLYNGLTFTGPDATAGKGDAIDIQYVGSTQTVEEGTYLYTGLEDDFEKLHIWDASVVLGYDAATGNPTSSLPFTKGTVVVTKSGDNYTVIVDGVAGGKVVKGTFTGVISLAKDID